jgi:hypothetical protein
MSARLHDLDSDSLADAGETIIYSFTVTNTGAVTLHAVTVDDSRLASLHLSVSCPGRTLAPGASMVCTSSVYTVTQADVDAGRVPNVPTSSGVTPPGKKVTSPPSTAKVPTDRPWLRISLAYTGSNALQLLGYALLLLCLGAVLLLLGRRSRRAVEPTNENEVER